MSEEITAESALAEFLSENAATFINKDGAFCTNFVLVAEYVDADGQFWTLVLKDEKMPVWRHLGLLEHVINNELYTEEEEEGEY
jgi:hypothetical protein